MSEFKLKEAVFIKVKDILPAKHCYNVIVKVTNLTESERVTNKDEKVKVVEGTVADETGSANFKFVGDHTKNVHLNSVIAIRNGRSSIVNEHILLELDKFGKVSVEDSKAIAEPNTTNNISNTVWEKKTVTSRNPK